MYTRSYYDSDGSIHSLPQQGYDGTALQKSPPKENKKHSDSANDDLKREVKISPSIDERDEPAENDEAVNASNEVGRSRIGGYLKSLFGKDIFPFHLPKRLDFEDLLLIGLAAYLLLSKSGDKECAILLALLIFIK